MPAVRHTYRGVCVICGEHIGVAQSYCYRVKGWAPERSGGGANQILQRERVGEDVAHRVCIDSQARFARLGIHPQQGGLL